MGQEEEGVAVDTAFWRQWLWFTWFATAVEMSAIFHVVMLFLVNI